MIVFLSNNKNLERIKRLKEIKNILKGIFVGGTMTVPGVSGGTMAIIVGIYEELISAVNNLKTNPAKSVKILIEFLVGAGIGFVMLAGIVSKLLKGEETGAFMSFFFCGIVLGGVPLLVTKSKTENVNFKDIIYVILGVVIVLSLSFLPEGSFRNDNLFFNVILQFIGGIVVAIALILPGISATHMLYVLGMYNEVLENIYNLRFLQIMPIITGVILGTFLTSKWIEKLLYKYTKEIYLIIIGFVIGSVVSLLKGVVVLNFFAYLMFIPGALIIFFSSRKASI